MAKIKNITKDTLSLFATDAPPVDPGGEVTIRDERFVNRSWPKSTWELVEPPELEGYADASIEDAWLWAVPAPEAGLVGEQGPEVVDLPAGTQVAGEPKAVADMTVPELKEFAAAAEVDLAGATKKADIIAAIAAVTEED